MGLARCHLALGDAAAARNVASTAAPVLADLAEEQPVRFGAVAASLAIVDGLAACRLGQSAQAEAAFARAATLNERIITFSPRHQRSAAAIAWFSAAHLRDTGRPIEARAILEAGVAAARAFAAFGIMDGAAILAAFEKELGDP